MAKKDVLVKKYLEEFSLVESNIRSFNDFVKNRAQQILRDLNETLANDEYKISFGKVRIEKPSLVEADGSVTLLTPTIARLRNITYSAPVFVEMNVQYHDHTESSEVEIGRIPVMVRSCICNTNSMSNEEMIKQGMDPRDPGGYFIINGNERIVVMLEDLAPNQPFIEESGGKLNVRVFSEQGAYRIPTTINETNEGIIEITFSRLKNVPVVVVLKALGMEREGEIAKHIGLQDDTLVVNFYEFANIKTSEEAMLYIAERSGTQGTKKEILQRIKQRIDTFLLPHIGSTQKARYDKAVTLCKLVKTYLKAKSNPEVRIDKDHYANKRIKLSGDLMADLFRVNLNIFIRDVHYSLQKTVKRKKFYSLKTIAKSTLFTHRIESAMATGYWLGERSGVTQNMSKTNYFDVLSSLQKVTSVLPGEQENFAARTLHPTHYGRFCPIETPEGTEIGLRKNLALLARISNIIPLEEESFVKMLEKLGLVRSSKIEQAEVSGNATEVFLDGKYLGVVENAHEFVNKLREARRRGELNEELGIRFDDTLEQVIISTAVGRVLRALIVVKDGKSLLTEEHLEMLEQGKLSWKELVEQGVIEYIDAGEEENALVAEREEDLTEEHTHLEVHPLDLFGLITSLVVYANHDQAPRLNRGSKTWKQGISIYAANYLIRIDNDVSVLHYPQKPLVRSFVYDALKIYPAGQNVVVAVVPFEGYNLEDAIVLKESSVERGLFRSTYFRPYTEVELQYAGGLSDEIAIPEKDSAGYRTEEAYKFLEDDGVVYPEAQMQAGDVVIGKMTPPKFLSEARDLTIQGKKEASAEIRQGESGVVDGVFVTVDSEGNKVVHVRMRDSRCPEIGDKFSSPHGQKGVIGFIAHSDDVPFTARGVQPDLMFNPHGIPGRRTVGYLLELLATKTAAVTGKVVDGTPFTGQSVEELEQQLKEMGFSYDGTEEMYDGVTGKKLKARIYVGNMYYFKLKRMVKNLIHARASGKVALLTRQPVGGRARGGGLRLGEMEQQALAAHGASLLLKERYDSDKTIIHICEDCGSLAYEDAIRDKTVCPLCGGNETQPVEVSYAFKLLVDELLGLGIHTKFKLKNKFEQ
ncbi:DNA-directed RNA polymerase subunit B'' [Candidatus Pacearchaeota archaeon]|nr:MAG: DNA-directed RNA polymerase subunit B'' [Candidatus Pacearchaeota archaeon]